MSSAVEHAYVGGPAGGGWEVARSVHEGCVHDGLGEGGLAQQRQRELSEVPPRLVPAEEPKVRCTPNRCSEQTQ
jgi:hypothetical protein